MATPRFHLPISRFLGIAANYRFPLAKIESNCCWHRNARAPSAWPHCSWSVVCDCHRTTIRSVPLSCQSLRVVRWIHYCRYPVVWGTAAYSWSWAALSDYYHVARECVDWSGDRSWPVEILKMYHLNRALRARVSWLWHLEASPNYLNLNPSMSMICMRLWNRLGALGLRKNKENHKQLCYYC